MEQRLVKGNFTYERTKAYDFEVLYNHKTHSIDRVVSLVMNGSIRISMNQETQKHILDTLNKENLSKEEL